MTLRAASLILAAVAALGAPRALGADAVEERNRKEALAHYRAGEEARRSEDFEAAEREYRAAIRLDPLLTLAHYGLGQTCMSARRYPEAVEAFVGARESYAQVAALAVTDRVAADQRREDEIRELKDSLRAIQSGHRRRLHADGTLRRGGEGGAAGGEGRLQGEPAAQEGHRRAQGRGALTAGGLRPSG